MASICYHQEMEGSVIAKCPRLDYALGAESSWSKAMREAHRRSIDERSFAREYAIVHLTSSKVCRPLSQALAGSCFQSLSLCIHCFVHLVAAFLVMLAAAARRQ